MNHYIKPFEKRDHCAKDEQSRTYLRIILNILIYYVVYPIAQDYFISGLVLIILGRELLEAATFQVRQRKKETNM